jgi:hypothetical protein
MRLSLRKRCVSLNLQGGLGNQMFRLASGINVSILSGKTLILNTRWFSSNFENTCLAKRRYHLDYFPNTRQFKLSNSPYLKFRINQYIGRLPGFVQKLSGHVTEESYEYFHSNNFAKSKWVNGNFDSIRYFPGSDFLSYYFTFPTEVSDWLVGSRKLSLGRPTVAMHIRMGDYLNFPEIYDVLDVDYYLSALAILKNQHKDFFLICFTDDIDQAKNFLKGKVAPDVYLGDEPGVSPGEVLRFMSESESIITANSTFSWWAAYLGSLNGTTKTVFIPDKYINNKNYDPRINLLLDDWTMLPSMKKE